MWIHSAFSPNASPSSRSWSWTAGNPTLWTSLATCSSCTPLLWPTREMNRHGNANCLSRRTSSRGRSQPPLLSTPQLQVCLSLGGWTFNRHHHFPEHEPEFRKYFFKAQPLKIIFNVTHCCGLLWWFLRLSDSSRKFQATMQSPRVSFLDKSSKLIEFSTR